MRRSSLLNENIWSLNRNQSVDSFYNLNDQDEIMFEREMTSADSVSCLWRLNENQNCSGWTFPPFFCLWPLTSVWTKRSIWISPYLLSPSHPHTLYCLSYLYRPFIWDPDYSSSNKTQQFSSLNQENRKVGLFYSLISASHQRTATEASLAQVSITDSKPTLSQWRKDRVLTSPRGSI